MEMGCRATILHRQIEVSGEIVWCDDLQMICSNILYTGIIDNAYIYTGIKKKYYILYNKIGEENLGTWDEREGVSYFGMREGLSYIGMREGLSYIGMREGL